MVDNQKLFEDRKKRLPPSICCLAMYVI